MTEPTPTDIAARAAKISVPISDADFPVSAIPAKGVPFRCRLTDTPALAVDGSGKILHANTGATSWLTVGRGIHSRNGHCTTTNNKQAVAFATSIQRVSLTGKSDDDDGAARPPHPSLPHPGNRQRQLPVQEQLGRRKEQEDQDAHLTYTRSTQEIPQGGSNLDENAGSVLSKNQHDLAEGSSRDPQRAIVEAEAAAWAASGAASCHP